MNTKSLQAGIIKATNKRYFALLFLRIKSHWGWSLAEFLQSLYLSNAEGCNIPLSDSSVAHDKDKVISTIHFSKSLYKKYRIPSKLTPRDIAFRKGAKLSAITHLKERGPQNWLAPFNEGFDLMIHLNSDAKDALDATVSAILSYPDMARFTVSHIEHGEKLVNKNGKAIEHFGYRDGISNPSFNPDSEFEPEKLVLANDPLGDLGSYLVYRRIRQNVNKFEQQTRQIATQLGVSEDAAGSLIVGRNKQGQPLADGKTSNDFDFANDKQGLITPLCSHIRKSNSRLARDIPHRLIVRRGVPYAYNEEKGLHFLCFQQDIMRQFEFIQKSWLNHHDADTKEGIDPIANSSNKSSFNIWLPDKNGDLVSCHFSQVVEVTGGEYLFTPSISGVKNLIAHIN